MCFWESERNPQVYFHRGHLGAPSSSLPHPPPLSEPPTAYQLLALPSSFHTPPPTPLPMHIAPPVYRSLHGLLPHCFGPDCWPFDTNSFALHEWTVAVCLGMENLSMFGVGKFTFHIAVHAVTVEFCFHPRTCIMHARTYIHSLTKTRRPLHFGPVSAKKTVPVQTDVRLGQWCSFCSFDS